MSSTKSRDRLMLAALLLLAVIVVTTLLYPPSEWLPLQAWGQALESAGFAGLALFMAGGVIATSIGLPRQLVAFVAALAYGLLQGVLVSLLAALCGCALTLFVSRRFFRDAVFQRYPKAVSNLDRLVRHDAMLKIIVLRLQPFGTNLLTNVCAGLTTMPTRTFLLASAIGYIPQMVVFGLLGTGIRVESQARIATSVVLFVLSLLIGAWLYRRHLERR